MDETILRPLTQLGLTELEVEVYVFLLQESPATGYRIAQALGRPVAGVYKAIPSLVQKGALLLEEGESRQCRAVPAAELLARLERRFQESRSAAATALAGLAGAAGDDRVYPLRSLEQVLERARAILGRAEELAMVDGFPETVRKLREEIEATARRGVRVAAISYGSAPLAGVPTAVFPATHSLVQSFPGQWLIVIRDSAELLLAFLDEAGERLLQAVWTESPFLCWTLQGFMVSEFIFVRAMEDPDMPVEAGEVVRRSADLFPHDPSVLSGYARLLQRLGRKPAPEELPPPDPGRES